MTCNASYGITRAANYYVFWTCFSFQVIAMCRTYCCRYVSVVCYMIFLLHCINSLLCVMNILLQLFDDGHLTDSHGRKVDFRNVIVVMTSNIGANVIAELPPHLTGSEPAVQESIMEVVRGTLSPELLKYVCGS